ncbi:MAG: sensor histidine kinase [Thermodesulfobacteriota bacterium]
MLCTLRCSPLLFFLLLLPALCPAATPPTRHVLVLHSYHNGLKWVEDINSGLFKVLLAKDRNDLELHVEYLDAMRLGNGLTLAGMKDLIAARYQGVEFAAVIAVDDIAIEFLGRHRQLFGPAQLFFCGKVGGQPLDSYQVDEMVGVVEDVDMVATLTMGVDLYPETRRVIIINDDSLDGRRLTPLVDELERRFPSREFVRFKGLAMEQVVERVSRLTGNELVLLVNFSRDGAGEVFSYEQAAWHIASRCKVPILTMWDYYLGSGVLGGLMISGVAQGEKVARLVIDQAWGGQDPLAPVVSTENRFIFDYNKMKWFSVSYGDLPPESKVTKEPQSVLWKYKQFGWSILGVALALEFTVIVLSVLMYRSKKAEAELSEHRNHLEELVEQRTVELSSTNDQLIAEIDERKKVEEALLESEEVLHQLSDNLLTVQENERQRISAELHDELGQSLAALKLQLRGVAGGLDHQPLPVLQQECQELRSSINDIIENVRRLSRDLSPVLLDDLGIDAALEYLVNSFCKLSGIEAKVNLVEINHLFGQNSQRMIYRIIQESLNNMGKHARASHFELSIEKRSSRIFLVVKDNGKGFNVDAVLGQVSAERGMGLTAMAERVRILRGTLDVESSPGLGTTIMVTVPV